MNKILSEKTLKLKTKIFIFSLISLFIGLTHSLPKNIVLLGLKIEENQHLIGWFLFWITVTISINFIIYSLIDLSKYFKNSIIKILSKNIQSETIGLTL